MKEFIIKDDENVIYEHDKRGFDFVTNDESDKVSTNRNYNFRAGPMYSVNDTRDKKKVIYSDTNNDYDITHRNYMEYLDIAYSRDFGLIIKPDFIWYTILCELATLIKDDPETYREYFSDKPDKQKVYAKTDKIYNVPVKKLMEEIWKKVPSDLTDDMIVPKFTTIDKDSEFAFRSAFLDVVSPYYSPVVYACGYNKIKILGEQSDYQLIIDSLSKIVNIIPEFMDYSIDVGKTINDMIENWDNVDYWKDICKTETNYGTRVIDGWFRSFYVNEITSTYNVPEHLTKVDYTDEHDNEYTLYVGILSSKLEDGYLIPRFNKIVAQKVNKKLEQCQTEDQKQ